MPGLFRHPPQPQLPRRLPPAPAAVDYTRTAGDSLGSGAAAPAHVQYLGGGGNNTAAQTSTVISPSAKTVTVGNTIFVAWAGYYDITPSGVTDNLGNAYTRVERNDDGGSNYTADLWSAPVTTGGSITTITVAHPSTQYIAACASEFSGVGSLNAVGGGLSGSSNTATWSNSKTIPANGLAVGGTFWTNATAHSAGAASGSPSTTIYLSDDHLVTSGISVSICYAIAGGSDVTTFSGTTTFGASDVWTGAGGQYDPVAGSGITEAAVGVKVANRTSGDSIGTLSDAATRAFIGTRSVAGSTIGTLSETATRLSVKARTAADTISSLSETAVRAIMAKVRTAGDSLGSLSEAAIRAFVGIRQAADSIGSLSEAANRLAVRARTAADSIGTLSEAAVRAATAKARTAADSIGTLSEATARAFTGSRAISDAMGAISEAVVGVKSGATALVRTAADSIATLAESIGRAFVGTRTAGDSIGSLSEVANRLAVRARTVADSVGSLSEAAVRLAVRARTAADSISTLTEAAVRGASAWARTGADAIGTLAEAASRAVAMARSAGDGLATLAEAALRAPLAVARTAGDAVSTLTEAVVGIKYIGASFVRTAGDAIGWITERVINGGGGLAPRIAAIVSRPLGVAQGLLGRGRAASSPPGGSAIESTPDGEASTQEPRG